MITFMQNLRGAARPPAPRVCEIVRAKSGHQLGWALPSRRQGRSDVLVDRRPLRQARLHLLSSEQDPKAAAPRLNEQPGRGGHGAEHSPKQRRGRVGVWDPSQAS